MKKTILILAMAATFLCADTSSAITWPWQKRDKDKVEQVESSNKNVIPASTQVLDTQPSSVQKAKSLIKELNVELADAKAENSKLKHSLDQAKGQIAVGLVEIEKLGVDIQKLKDWGVAQQAEYHKWSLKYKELSHKYFLIKNILAVIFGVTLLMIYFRYGSPAVSTISKLTGAWSPAVDIGAPILVFVLGFGAIYLIF